MKSLINFHKTPLYIAVEKGDFEIVQILLSHPKIDINLQSVLYVNISNSIQIPINHYIQKYCF